jgi:hypothetical protein
MQTTQPDFIDQMQKGAGNARYWLAQVEQGFRPHMDGKDNTAAFVAHYERQLANCEAFLAHA